MPEGYMYMLSEYIGSEACFVQCGDLWQVLAEKRACLEIDYHAVLYIQRVQENGDYETCYNF